MSDPPTSDQQAHDGLSDESAEISPDGLRAAVIEAAAALIGAAGDGVQIPSGEAFSADSRGGITLERPPRPDFGDYSTNAALLLAPRLRRPPREVAEQLGDRLASALGPALEHFDVAGPGFVNLFVADAWLRRGLGGVLVAAEDYGAVHGGSPERIMVEFVSANPTGPMHVGHARNAAYGDALARMLELRGAKVEREFYVNDAGSQVRTFGESIQALARGGQVPEDGYQGDYVAELAAHIENAAERDAADVGRVAVALMIGQIQTSLAAFGVGGFDYWAYESKLHEGEPSLVDHALARLHELGHTYTSDGALWLRSTTFGDDKDRVLVRSNGEFTYLASDVAYHEDKRERGFDRLIDVWGADHHGYVLRLKAAFAALGGNPDDLELLIMQLVHLVRSGDARRCQSAPASSSRSTSSSRRSASTPPAGICWRARTTRPSTSTSTWRAVSPMRTPCTTCNTRTPGSPRCSPRRAPSASTPPSHRLLPARRPTAHRLGHPRRFTPASARWSSSCSTFLASSTAAAERRAPHRVASYALELAQGFTAFYRDCRVLGAEPTEVESERLALCVASRDTIARCLDLLGVSAPREM